MTDQMNKELDSIVKELAAVRRLVERDVKAAEKNNDLLINISKSLDVMLINVNRE